MLCTTKGALHRIAVGVQPSPAQRLARDQRVEPVGLHPSAGGLALAGRAAPLGRAALRVRRGEPPSCQEPKIGAGAYRRVDAVAAEAAALAVAIAERRLELTAGAPGAGAGPGSGAPTRRCARKAALSPGLRTTHIRFRVRVTAVVSAGAHEKPAQDENRKLHPPAIRVSLSHERAIPFAPPDGTASRRTAVGRVRAPPSSPRAASRGDASPPDPRGGAKRIAHSHEMRERGR